MEEMITNATTEQKRKIVQAFLPMKKSDIAAIERVIR